MQSNRALRAKGERSSNLHAICTPAHNTTLPRRTLCQLRRLRRTLPVCRAELPTCHLYRCLDRFIDSWIPFAVQSLSDVDVLIAVPRDGLRRMRQTM